jgi:hypothetical protein
MRPTTPRWRAVAAILGAVAVLLTPLAVLGFVPPFVGAGLFVALVLAVAGAYAAQRRRGGRPRARRAATTDRAAPDLLD